jgi:hypothetical protein
MSRYYPPKIQPLAPIEAPITTGEAARAQMLDDSAITRANVLAHMNLDAKQTAELEAAMAMFSQMLIGDLSDDEALETFTEKP